jgi:3',5'-cyclic AMP phosphodiesterase CpdA
MVDIKQQFLKRKKVIAIAILILLVGIIIRELYSDAQDDIEEYYVYKVLSKAPKNLNAEAIHKIQENIGIKKNFSFIVLGDSQGQLETFKKVVKEALGHKPDFIINTGDMTSSGKYHQYVDFIRELKNIVVPVVCIIGNHDDNNLGEQCFTHIFGPNNFYFSINDYLFVFLDNTVDNTSLDFVELGDSASLQKSYGFEGGFDNHQIEQLKILLRKGKKTFISMHKPPPIEPFLFHSFHRNSSSFLDLMRRFKDSVEYVFCGHIHGYSETTYDDNIYVVTGGAGADLIDNRKNVTGKYNYILVNVDGGNIEHKVYFPKI